MTYRFGTERAGVRDWLRYAACRLIGHNPREDGGYYYCGRCLDVLPHGRKWE